MDTEEKSVYVLVLIGAGIVGIILLYFIAMIIRHHRKTSKLHLEQVQAEIRALERERNRIATDLHDDLGPMLSAVRLKINALEPSSKEDEHLIATINHHLDDSLTRIREIAFNLLPGTLVRKGLIVTFEEFLSKTEKHLPFKVRFLHYQQAELNQEVAVNMYRIMLEILHNSIKHAKATELSFELNIHRNKLSFRSQDNGIGFDPVKIKLSDDGLGLKTLQSRVLVMGGDLQLHTSPGKGVLCFFEIPL
jgi:two-component system NarL family sensor kinase